MRGGVRYDGSRCLLFVPVYSELFKLDLVNSDVSAQLLC
jgi:hypothetical protein